MGLKSKYALLGLLLLFIWRAVTAQDPGVFDVKTSGAVPDGKTDSTKAFEDAWQKVCAAEGQPKMLIPEGDYFIGPLTFKGPCKGTVTVELKGELLASTDLNIFGANWLIFEFINGLTLTGGGTINAQGKDAWPHNKCPQKWDCKILPNSISFGIVNDTSINNVALLDAKMFHMTVFQANNVTIDSLKITAPEDSPNTDGMHIARASNIFVSNCVIGTGDDCISIGPGTKQLSISGITCGPGHGISIGSLGKNPEEEDVEGVTVKNCTLTKTMNGLRIKTWQSSPTASQATGFLFEDITMNDVNNPIIIDQEYCPYKSCEGKDPSLVKIKDIKFKNVKGTSSSNEAVKLICSDSHPCEGLDISDIHFTYSGQKDNKSLVFNCQNAQGSSANIQNVESSCF